MDTQIQPMPFQFESHEVRALLDAAGEPWFVLGDVAKAMECRMASDLARSIPDEEKGSAVVRTLGGDQKMVTVNEWGLYRVVLQSRTERAETFKRWVIRDVIPAIRKTGTYTKAPTENPDVAALLALSKSQLLRMAAEQAEQIERQEMLIAAQAPKAAAHDRYLHASGTMSLRDTAKTLGLREQTFITALISDGVLYRTPGECGRLRAYAHHEETGRFVHRAGTAETSGKAYTQVRVTPAGLDWLSQRYQPERPQLPAVAEDV